MDHRLILVPQMLREKNDGAIPVVFHLGVPFPSSEIIRCHPQAKEIMQGILRSNLIVFQAFSYIHHFISTCTRVLGLDSNPKYVDFNGLPVQLRVIPVGVDADAIRSDIDSSETAKKFEAMRKVFQGKRILLGIDGPETVKGIMHSLKAFEQLLSMQPKWIGEIVLVQIMTTEKQEQTLVDLAGRINNRFGYLGFNPVQLFHISALESAEYISLLTIADVLMVISERAAFSIPALDYVICQDKRYGQIIISEFVGQAVFMPSAFLVNPWDHKELANVMQDALTVPIDDMILRHGEISGTVTKFGARFWFDTMIAELREAYENSRSYLITPPLDMKSTYLQYLGANKRLFLLDYDGTLTGIKKTPSEATPSPELIMTLCELCADVDNLVYVISGRDKYWLETALGRVPRLGLSAEHGCFLKPIQTNGSKSDWISLINEDDLIWRDSVLQIMQYYAERTPGSLVEKKTASLTWHYRLSDNSFGTRQANELQNYLENTVVENFPVEVITGKKNVEVRPSMASKAKIVKNLMERHAHSEGFILCIGDDRTDEDMFKYLLEERAGDEYCLTCKVGSSKTSAKFSMRNSGQVVALLGRLALASKERRAHSTI